MIEKYEGKCQGGVRGFLLNQLNRILLLDRPGGSDSNARGVLLNRLSRILVTPGLGRLEDRAQGQGFVENRAQRRQSIVQSQRETIIHRRMYISIC